VTEKKVGLLAGIAAAVILAGIAGTVAFYKVPAFHALLHPHADNAAVGSAAKPEKGSTPARCTPSSSPTNRGRARSAG